MSRPRGPDGQFLPKAWPLDENGKPKREALAAKDPIAVAHREEKPYSKEAKEERRKVPRETSGTRDPATGQLQGGIPGHAGSFGRTPALIREKLREGLAAAIPSIIQAAQDEEHSNHKWAVDFCGKHGLGTTHDVTVDDGFTRFLTYFAQLPAESLKKIEAMSDRELEQAMGWIFGNDREDAAASLVRKLNAMREAQEPDPAPEAPAPRKALPKPKKAEPKPRPDRSEEVIAEFYDGGLPKATQEPTEEVEAVAEESQPVPRKESYFYSQNGARVIPMSEFGYVRKS